MSGTLEVRTRRVYDDPSSEDGTRVLVDRISPRGLAKARAGIDEWARAVAPSTELRRCTDTTRPGSRSSAAAIRPSWPSPARVSAMAGR